LPSDGTRRFTGALPDRGLTNRGLQLLQQFGLFFEVYLDFERLS
jgi:hypothetical protein